MATVRALDRFPIAGLPDNRRPAFWEGDFHEVRDSGLRHAAYDIFVTADPATAARYKGAAIVAPISGHVLARHPRSSLPGAGRSERGGYYVWIRGADGLDYYFAHMASRPLVHPGDRVVAGTQIGVLGDSGNAHGRPHLHFAVKTQSGSSVEAYRALRDVEPTSHLAPLGAPGRGSSFLGPALAVGIPLGLYGLWRLLS